MNTWIPRSLRDDGMIPMNESPSYHQCVHQFVRLEDHHATLAEKDAEIERLKGLFADANNDDVLIKQRVIIDQLQAKLDRASSENKELRAKLNGYTTFLVKRGPYNMLNLRDASTPIVIPETTTLQDILDDLDRVVGDAVWAMTELRDRLCVVDEYNREIKPERERELQIATFLASPLVQSRCDRQGKEAG